MASFRILITGSREWVDLEKIERAIQSISIEQNIFGFPVVIVHGGARGADSLAGKIARMSFYVTEEVHPVDWRPAGVYNPYAGHARNQKMVDLGADVCLAFFQSGAGNRGTADCVYRAERKGIPVVKIWSDDE